MKNKKHIHILIISNVIQISRLSKCYNNNNISLLQTHGPYTYKKKVKHI